MSFDLIIPVYNPLADWECRLIKNLYALINTHPEIKHHLNFIIIVNDGSTNSFTEKEIHVLINSGLPVQILGYKENRGKGFALREGVKNSTGDYCIYTDADMPFGFSSINLVIQELQKGIDIVVGCRNKKLYFLIAPFKRRLISKILMGVNRYILNLPVDDTQAGIKGFNSFGKDLFLTTTTNRFLFDLEFVLLASKVKDISLLGIDVAPAADIHLSNFRTRVLMQELMNLCKIIYKRKKLRDAKKDIAWV